MVHLRQCRSGLRFEFVRRILRSVIRFINRRILQVVDGILARPGRESVIVLAADHGPGSEFVWDGGASRNTDAGLRERFAILSAVRVRPTLTAKLYPQITPVNSFRIILDDYLGTSLGLLPDRCYVSTESEPFRLVDVTDRVRGPGAPASRPAESDDP